DDAVGLRLLSLVPSGIGAGSDRVALAYPAPFPHKLPLAEQGPRHVNCIETAHIARRVDAGQDNHAALLAAASSLSCFRNLAISSYARWAHFASGSKSI